MWRYIMNKKKKEENHQANEGWQEEKTEQHHQAEADNVENEAEEDQEQQTQEESEEEKLRREYKELHEKYIRLMSEFDNFRKRTQQEKADLQKNASEKLIIELLPILDDLDRALDALKEEGKTDEKGYEGVNLIHDKFKKLLQEKGVEEIPAMGEKFDSEYHEALSTMKAPSEEKKGTIIDVVQKGYQMNDKILRHTKAIVGE